MHLICQIIKHINSRQPNPMDANWMNSFVGTKRTAKSIAPARDEAVEVPQAMVLEGVADFCYTGDIWHLTVDSAAVLDKRGEMQRAENLSMPTRHLRVSRESRFRCAPIGDAGKVPQTLQNVFHSNLNQRRPSCTCYR